MINGKQLESTSVNLTPWYLLENTGWPSLSWERVPALMKNFKYLGCCSQERVRWCCWVHRLQWCRCCTKLPQYQSICVFQHSPELCVMTERNWDSRCKWMKWVYLARCLGSPQGTGWMSNIEIQKKLRRICCFEFKGASWGGSGIWLGCLLDAFLWRLSGHVQVGGNPGADLRQTGLITYRTRSEKTLNPPEGAGGCGWEGWDVPFATLSA